VTIRQPWPLALAAAVACSSAPPAREASAPAARTATASDSTFAALHRQIANGSILADVQIGRNPPMAVGACLDPVAAARIELDRRLEFVPEQPPTVIGGIIVPALPESLRDSEMRTGTVTARWVVDTNGVAIPASVTIDSSPHGLMSAQVCGAIFLARFNPARDDGRKVAALVRMPVRFVP
jgi:hypothetical protein